MNKDKLNKFVNEVVAINAAVPGTGMSAGGYLGSITARQAAVLDLKKNVLDFAKECRKPSPSKSTLESLFEEIEGGLQLLRSFSIIDDARLNRLITQLDTLR